MKKFIVTILLIIISINSVHASEFSEITKDTEIKYRWYKEVITGDYYPLQTITSKDKVDLTKIKYGEFSNWKPVNCSRNEMQYDIEKREIYVYEKVKDVRYILLENFTYNNNIEIYYQNNPINFEIISNQNNQIKIDLKKNYIIETLLIGIDSDAKFRISYYSTNEFKEEVAAKEINNEKIIVVDKSWNIDKNQYVQINTETNYPTSDLTKKISFFYTCKYREIYVYKYEITREYYDNNYYSNVDGYIKDLKDYKIFYKIKPLTNTIEITKEKIIKEPITEYIYIEKENNKQENDSSNKIENEIFKEQVQEYNCIPEIKKEIIEKTIFKIPPKIYLIIILLIITIIILGIRLRKKYVT